MAHSFNVNGCTATENVLRRHLRWFMKFTSFSIASVLVKNQESSCKLITGGRANSHPNISHTSFLAASNEIPQSTNRRKRQ